MKYLVIVEKGPNSFSAYVPDLPGCTSAGDTLEETRTSLRDAIRAYLANLAEDERKPN